MQGSIDQLTGCLWYLGYFGTVGMYVTNLSSQVRLHLLVRCDLGFILSECHLLLPLERVPIILGYNKVSRTQLIVVAVVRRLHSPLEEIRKQCGRAHKF